MINKKRQLHHPCELPSSFGPRFYTRLIAPPLWSLHVRAFFRGGAVLLEGFATNYQSLTFSPTTTTTRTTPTNKKYDQYTAPTRIQANARATPIRGSTSTSSGRVLEATRGTIGRRQSSHARTLFCKLQAYDFRHACKGGARHPRAGRR